MLTWLLGRFGNVPDANGNMLTAIRAPAFRLGHFHDFACNALQPLIDALFVRRLHERLTMTANKRKHLYSLAQFHTPPGIEIRLSFLESTMHVLPTPDL